MPAAQYDFTIEQGSDFTIFFRYFDENNQPVNLKNTLILFRFLDDTGSLRSFDNVTKTTDYSLIGDENGNITIFIPAKITDTYTFASAQYELDIQEPNELFFGSGMKSNRVLFGSIGTIQRQISPPNRSELKIFPPANDMCPPLMLADAMVYTGPSLIIADNAVVGSSVFVNDPRTIKYLEVGISGLNHTNPQDLNIVLKGPTQTHSAILLCGSEKMTKYTPGFSFILSDRASADSSVFDVDNMGICLTKDKTNYIRFRIPELTADASGGSASGSGSGSSLIEPEVIYNNYDLLHSFNSLIGTSATGNWTLYVCDHDDGAIGFIYDWKLYITYNDIFES